MSSKRRRKRRGKSLQYFVYTFEWKFNRGTIGNVVADDIDQAWARLMQNLEVMQHFYVTRTLKAARKRKALSKVIRVFKSEVPKGMVWQVVKPPHG